MPKFVITHGGLKHSGTHHETGATVDLDVKEALALDAKGEWLVPAEKHAALKKAKAELAKLEESK